MSRVPGIVAVSTLGGLAFVALFAFLTWTYVFDSVDRVMVLMLLGLGSLGGQ